MEITIQKEYDLIYSFFKTTNEPFDELDWDGSKLKVILKETVIEEYSVTDLKEFVKDL